MSRLLNSGDLPAIEWADTPSYAQIYGVKAAGALAIPRSWSLPFLLISSDHATDLANGVVPKDLTGFSGAARLAELAGDAGQLIVRSSVVGESIWDRGTYESVRFAVDTDGISTERRLIEASERTLASTSGRPTGLMLQRYLQPSFQGEFGNLLRVSKTRDHWEIATREADEVTSRARLNSQRDSAADSETPLSARAGLSRERLFGGVGAWLNNELLLGRSQRLNCEWISYNRRFYLVQIDEEDEDLSGVNPFQVRVAHVIRPATKSGHYLKSADAAVLGDWDKLQVLEQLWEQGAAHKPTLFYLPIDGLPAQTTTLGIEQLTTDFADLIGPKGIVVRTSVRADAEKLPNLPRTECLTPEEAARWCLETAEELRREHGAINIAFIAHRFVASRASAWARAEPGNPVVEINTLWGLPDALQYCPYDIWEVHVPAGVATEYPDYKSDMLISRNDGGWEYVRVKNELARGNSIGSVEAKDIAFRSSQIAERLGRACHIMWFVGCLEQDGSRFNIPWYWTEAHQAERNPDRTTYRVFTVSDRSSLDRFVNFGGSRAKQALSLRPIDLRLMRDSQFIEAVGLAARGAQVPIILSGSTLAHAYYQLRKVGCTVVTPSEKEHARLRRTANLGKLVRDKIPDRIARRQEMRVTRRIEGGLRRGFLISKLFEEALEVREAVEPTQKVEELADLFEVLRAIAKSEGVSIPEIRKAADLKKRRSGGFEDGLVLLSTSIGTSEQPAFEFGRGMANVLGGQTTEDTAEIPFSFFGFMELDQPRSVYFENIGVHLELVLRPDRLEIRLSRGAEQLALPL